MGGLTSPEPIGVYDHEPPDDVQPQISAVRMADADSLFAGVGLLLRDATRARDAWARFVGKLIPG